MPVIAARVRSFLRCRVLRPLLRVMRKGVSPRRLAWSLAVAVVVGVNPLLGLTTLSMILLAWVFRLNHVATQIGIHLVAPLQWILFIPFIHAAIVLFHLRHMPLSGDALIHLSERHPVRLIRMIWSWEWHALIIWLVVAACVAPLIARQLRKLLVLSMRRHRELLTVAACVTNPAK